MSYYGDLLVLPAVVPLVIIVAGLRVGPARLLANWGVHQADAGDLALTRTHLRRGRLLYLVAGALSVALFLLTGSRLDGIGPFLLWVLLPLALALLVSELALVAHRRGGATTRRALLVPRSRRDYVPPWATRMALALLVLSLPALFFMPQLREGFAPHWDFWVATAIVGCLGLVAEATIRLAVARRPVVESAADTAMRVRSARSMAGLELGISGLVLLVTWTRVGNTLNYVHDLGLLALLIDILAVVGFVLALSCWGALASPPRLARPSPTAPQEA